MIISSQEQQNIILDRYIKYGDEDKDKPDSFHCELNPPSQRQLSPHTELYEDN